MQIGLFWDRLTIQKAPSYIISLEAHIEGAIITIVYYTTCSKEMVLLSQQMVLLLKKNSTITYRTEFSLTPTIYQGSELSLQQNRTIVWDLVIGFKGWVQETND